MTTTRRQFMKGMAAGLAGTVAITLGVKASKDNQLLRDVRAMKAKMDEADHYPDEKFVVLRKDEWKQLDEMIVDAAQNRLIVYRRKVS